MATSTTNLNLIKPADGEPVDVDTLNANSDTIDAQFGDNPFGHMGVDDGFQNIAAAAVINISNAQILKGGMTYDDAANALVVPKAGRYRIAVRGYGSGGGVGSWYDISARKNTVGIAGALVRIFQGGATDFFDYVECQVTLAVGDKIQLYGDSTAGSTWGTDGYNGTYLEVEYKGDV